MTIEEIHSLYLQCSGRVTTDSRAVRGGEMFIALKGENFDGNSYALKSLEAGAAFALVDEGTEAAASGDARVIAVPDTFQTLKDLACWHRNHTFVDGRRLTVIGLTGTNGKTTTKELIRAVLAAKYRVTATEGNLNNDIGVPLSLLKINSDTELAVIEMGANHPDDIARLVTVSQPDYGLITNVGKAHLLGFGSFEGVKKTKGELYDYLRQAGGMAFYNADNPHLSEMVRHRQGLRTMKYGVQYQKVKTISPTLDSPFLKMVVPGMSGEMTISTKLIGDYNADNVLAALCVGAYFEVPATEAILAIESYFPTNNRSQFVRTSDNMLIIDAYNANPTSMEAALENFSSIEFKDKMS